MAVPLPVIQVFSVADVESIATDGGPSRIVILQAESLSHACTMLSVLRAKGLLGGHHGDGGDDDASKGSGFSDADEGFEDGAHGFDEGGAGHGLGLDSFGPIGRDLDRLLLSDDDIVYAGSDGGAAHNWGNDDEVANGWEFDNLPRLLRASDLGRILDEVVADTLPRLVEDPTSSAALRDLRTNGRDVRRLGKEMPWLAGQAPVTLGNYIQKVVGGALKRGGSARWSWMEERRGRILVRVFAFYEQYPVSFL